MCSLPMTWGSRDGQSGLIAEEIRAREQLLPPRLWDLVEPWLDPNVPPPDCERQLVHLLCSKHGDDEADACEAECRFNKRTFSC